MGAAREQGWRGGEGPRASRDAGGASTGRRAVRAGGRSGGALFPVTRAGRKPAQVKMHETVI